VLPSEGRGHRFESCRVRHFPTTHVQNCEHRLRFFKHLRQQMKVTGQAPGLFPSRRVSPLRGGGADRAQTWWQQACLGHPNTYGNPAGTCTIRSRILAQNRIAKPANACRAQMYSF